MGERLDSYEEYLEKTGIVLTDYLQKLMELKEETEEMLEEFKKDESRAKDDEEFWTRIRRIEMLAVKAKMSHVLEIVKQHSAKLESWLDELKDKTDKKADEEEEQ